jgi:hypothetical protein
MRTRRRSLILAGTAVTVFGLLFGVVPFYLGTLATSRRFTYKDRENEGVTPGTLGLAFEEIRLNSADNVALGGWWIPASSPKGSVILVHGLNRSRLEMVRKIPFLHSLGWNALALDLRRHGTSGGDRATFGALEMRDVAAAVAFARSRSEGPVVAWGVRFVLSVAAGHHPSPPAALPKVQVVAQARPRVAHV